MFSQAEENYLKAIHSLEIESDLVINTNLIAQRIQTKASSVTDMLQRLSDKELVHYKKYKGAQLTESGKKIATSVIRKHRLWESFLVLKLNFSWDEVHEIAEQLEHIKSEKLIDKLDEYLGYPTMDPHGDPIPDKDGNFTMSKTKSILELKIGEVGVLESVKDSSENFLRYLNKKKLRLGNKIKVIDIEPFDETVVIEFNTTILSISKKIANNLYLKNVK
jgi:DtxR family Mn-dependent transcriptional regulator